MTYIDYLNHFHQWLESNALEASAQLMYLKLLHVFNRAGWPETVQVDNRRMELLLGGVAKTTVIRARERLMEAGFIRFQRGRRGAPNRYELVKEFSGATYSATESATESATQNATPIKTKTKNKTKTVPPKAPQGAGEGFERFWQAYPRRVGRGAAEKAWAKLRPDGDLTGRILEAVERDKGTDQWTRDGGQFIPHPATWLNQRRWLDDPSPPPPRRGPPKSYDIEELERMSVFDLPEELM